MGAGLGETTKPLYRTATVRRAQYMGSVGPRDTTVLLKGQAAENLKRAQSYPLRHVNVHGEHVVCMWNVFRIRS